MPIPYFLQNPDDPPDVGMGMGLPPPPPMELNFPAAPEEEEESPADILRRLIKQSQTQQAATTGIDAGKKFGAAFPSPEPDEDIQGFFANLIAKKFGDQERREREMQRTPMDYARERAKAYFGPEPTTKKGKAARAALQIASGVLGVKHPDFMQQGFEEWKVRQAQLQNEASTEQRLLTSQLAAVASAKRNESAERIKNMGSQAQFMIQAMKTQTDGAKVQLDRIKAWQNQGLIDAKKADMMASAAKKDLETSFMNFTGPLAYALKGQPLPTQITILESMGDLDMAKSLAESIGLTEAAKALGKSSSGQGTTRQTIEKVPVLGPDGVTQIGYQDVVTRQSSSTPNASPAAPGAAFGAVFQNKFGQPAPATAQMGAPTAQAPPRGGFTVSGTARAQKFEPKGDAPDGWSEIYTPHLPNVSVVPRTDDTTVYGYAVSSPGAPPITAFGKPPKLTDTQKEKVESRAAALRALATKAKSAVDAYMDSPPQGGIFGGGMLPFYERAFNRMKPNAGTDMRYMFGSGRPDRVSDESIKADQELFQRQQAENMATLLEEKDLVGRRGGPAMADRVKTMFATNIMNPQMYVLSAVGNSLLKNIVEKLRAFGMDEKYADGRLVDYISEIGEKVMKEAANGAQSPNKKAKEDHRQVVYKMLDPERVLVGYLKRYYPGETEFRNQTQPGREWVMTIGKPKKKKESSALDRETQQE